MALPDKSQKSEGLKTPPDKPSTFSSLFHDNEVITLYQTDTTNARQIWRRAEHPHSLLFDLSRTAVTDEQFRLALYESPLKEAAHGAIIHRSRKHTTAEVAFEDQETVDKIKHESITLKDGTQLFGSLPIPEDWEVVKVNLTQIPLYNRTTLTQALIDALKPFGNILELGIYLEQHYFTGKGFVYLNTNPKNYTLSKTFHVQPQQLSHSIPVSRKDGTYPTRMHATWSKMPLHCRYCHEPGHTRLQCPYRPKPRCYYCQEIGHLRKECHIRNGVKSAPAPIDKQSITTTAVTPTSRNPKPSPASKRKRSLILSPQQASFNFTPPAKPITDNLPTNDKPHDPVTDPHTTPPSVESKPTSINTTPPPLDGKPASMDTTPSPSSSDPPIDAMET